METHADNQEAVARGVFEAAYCSSLSYFFSIKHDDFRIDDFLLAVGGGTDKADPSGSFVCSSGRESTDYHLHISWRVKPKNDFSLVAEFYGKHRKQDPNEREPFAETFFQWVYQFFAAKEPHQAHIHVDFEYPSSVRNARVFLLPLKTVIGPKNIDVEIDGISFSPTPSVHGVEKFWLTQGPTELDVHLTAERLVDFERFDLKSELSVFSEAVDNVLGEEKQ